MGHARAQPIQAQPVPSPDPESHVRKVSIPFVLFFDSRSLLFSGGNHGQAAGRRPSRRGIDLMPNGGMAPPELLSRNPNSKSAALGLRRG